MIWQHAAPESASRRYRRQAAALGDVARVRNMSKLAEALGFRLILVPSWH